MSIIEWKSETLDRMQDCSMGIHQYNANYRLREYSEIQEIMN